MLWLAGYALSALFLAHPIAQAATISVSDLGPNNPAAVFVVGDLLAKDANEFRSKVGPLSKAIILFQSDGGNLVAGIAIGQTIRLKGFATVVPSEVRCASACALAWLGGRPRFMGVGARVGFHAASLVTAGQVSASGNALIGAYLNQIGLPYSAVVTEAPPESMTWLNSSEATEHGIDVLVLEGGKPSSSTRISSAPPIDSLEGRAARFVSAFVSGWSSVNTVSLASLASAYGDQVSYYGSVKTRQEVFIDKRRFSERWPERVYDVRGDSVAVQCAGAACKASGLVDWQTRSVARAASASGIAQFEYEVVPVRGAFAIVGENGSVVKRYSPEQGR